MTLSPLTSLVSRLGREKGRTSDLRQGSLITSLSGSRFGYEKRPSPVPLLPHVPSYGLSPLQTSLPRPLGVPRGTQEPTPHLTLRTQSELFRRLSGGCFTVQVTVSPGCVSLVSHEGSLSYLSGVLCTPQPMLGFFPVWNLYPDLSRIFPM